MDTSPHSNGVGAGALKVTESLFADQKAFIESDLYLIIPEHLGTFLNYLARWIKSHDEMVEKNRITKDAKRYTWISPQKIIHDLRWKFSRNKDTDYESKVKQLHKWTAILQKHGLIEKTNWRGNVTYYRLTDLGDAHCGWPPPEKADLKVSSTLQAPSSSDDAPSKHHSSPSHPLASPTDTPSDFGDAPTIPLPSPSQTPNAGNRSQQTMVSSPQQMLASLIKEGDDIKVTKKDTLSPRESRESKDQKISFLKAQINKIFEYPRTRPIGEKAISELTRYADHVSDTDLSAVEWFYGLPHDESIHELKTRRTSTDNLAIHLLTEIDRARNYAKKTGKNTDGKPTYVRRELTDSEISWLREKYENARIPIYYDQLPADVQHELIERQQ